MRGWRKTTEPTGNNPVIGDLYLDDGGESVPLLDSDEDLIRATAQEIRSRLLLFKGSYFVDLREGVPWYQEILSKGTTPGRVRELLRQAILSHPSVVDVPVLQLTIDRVTREASVVFEARTVEGLIVRSEEHGPVYTTTQGS